jgi:uncharacterized protein YfaS (alpha-2-macroglobulin family)
MTTLRRWQVMACLSVLANALLIGGYTLTRTLSTQPRLRSVVFTPETGGNPGTFRVRFATAMDADEALPGELPVAFTPTLAGSVRWEDGKTAIITPATDVLPGCNYRVAPRVGLCDRAGRELLPEPVSLRGEALRLIDTSAVVQIGPNRSRLVLRFNGPVHPDALRRHLRLTDATGARLEAQCEAAQPTTTPDVEFSHPQTLRRVLVEITDGLFSADGSAGLEAAVRFEREVNDRLTVHSLISEVTPDGLRLCFSASTALEVSSAADYIAITPALAGVTVESRGGWWGRDAWRLQGPFQPRTYYRVTFRKGMPSVDPALCLEADVTLAIVTGDLGAMVEFFGGSAAGLVIPGQRRQVVPVSFRNITQADLRAYRVYPNNLVAWSRGYRNQGSWEQSERGDQYGHFVGKISVEPGLPDNQAGTLNVPLEPLLKDCRRGLFVVSLQSSGRAGYGFDSRTLLLTDIGIGVVTTPRSALVWTLNLQDGSPLAGCDIELLSAKNQTIVRGTTTAAGTVLLAIPPGPAEEMTPFLAVARRADDLAFVRTDVESVHDLTPFRIPGRSLPEHAYEALVSTERGIARPGETVVAEVIVRDALLQAAAGLPCELRLRDGRGNVVERRPGACTVDGLFVQPLQLPLNSRSGSYSLEAGLPGDDATVWGETAVIVGEYRPDRIRCSLGLDRQSYAAGEAMQAVLQAQYYYGKALAGARSRFRVTFEEAPFAPPAFADFTFGDEDRAAVSAGLPLTAEADSDAAGKAAVEIQLPTELQPRAALRAVVSANATVPGGETVTATAVVPFHMAPYYLGLRLLPQPAEAVASKSPMRHVDWVAVQPDGALRAAPAPLQWELLAVDWDYVLRRDEGRYVRDWQRRLRPVATGELTANGDAGRGQLQVTCPGAGLYTLRLSSDEGRIQSSVTFWHLAGDGSVARVANPTVLPLRTDQDAYREGDTATLSFSSREAGHAVVTTFAANVESSTVQPVQAGANSLTVRVPATPLGTCFAAVTLILPAAGSTEASQRLFGVAALSVVHTDRHLQVDLEAPALARPGQTLPITVRLSTAGAPQAASVHVMVVDEGVLALTHHATPDPFAFFYGPRDCPAQFADLYGDITTDTAERFGAVAKVGGDGISGFLAPLKPEDVRHAVVLSRVLDVPAAGRSDITLELPDCTGEFRIMAVAVNPRALGSAARSVQVRSPLTVLATLPRVVAPGDEFQVSAVLSAEAGAAEGKAVLTLVGPAQITGPTAEQRLQPDAAGTAVVTWMCRANADAAGRVAVTVQAESGPHTRRVEEFLQVRPASLPVYRCRFERIAAGQAVSLTPDPTLLAGTGSATAQVAASNQVETTAALAWLLQYPYGCLEQSVSRALAYLALPAMFPATPQTGPLPEALRALLAAELPDGGFSMWPGGRELWLSGSLYACHFLAETERGGTPIEPSLRTRSLTFLRDAALGRAGGAAPISAADRAYALYLLAALGLPERDIAKGMATGPEEAALVRLLAAAALVRSGRAAEGMPLVEEALQGDLQQGQLGWDLDSAVRRNALALCVLNDIQPAHPAADRLLDALRRQRSQDGHWGTTLDNALVVLALSRRPPEPATGTAVVRLGGAERTQRITGAEVLTLVDAELRAGLSVTAADAPVFLAWQERGVPAALPSDDTAHGIALRRQYLTLDGAPATTFNHGDLILVRITLDTPLPRTDLVVADLLPGGVEIEDASLATREDAAVTRSSALVVKMAQKQDDRLVLCADTSGTAPLTYEYHVRAVSRGVFAIPRIRTEAMYDPEVAGESGGKGQLTIK